MKLQLIQNKGLPSPYHNDVFFVEYKNGKKVLHKILDAPTLNLLARLKWTDGWDKITQINSFNELGEVEFGEEILITKD